VAAEAAGDQGRYWAMHDLLFSTQQQWSHKPEAEAAFKALAYQLGLNLDQFVRSLRAPETRQRVADDIARARDLQVNATPTFFINGKKIVEPPQTVSGFLELVNR